MNVTSTKSNVRTGRLKTTSPSIVSYKITDTGMGDFTISVFKNGAFVDELRNRFGNRRFFTTRGSARKAIWRKVNGVTR